MKLPQGYEPHEIPADYTGPLFIEGQMRWMYDLGYDDGFLIGAEKGRNISEEIKQLRQELAIEEKRFSAQWEILASSQARETKLREALHQWVACCKAGGIRTEIAFPLKALEMPHDDTALKEAIKQAKREALLEAADAMEDGAFETPYGLRRMAEELK